MKNQRFFGYEDMARNKDNWAFVEDDSPQTTKVFLHSHSFTKALNVAIGNLGNILIEGIMKTPMKIIIIIPMHQCRRCFKHQIHTNKFKMQGVEGQKLLGKWVSSTHYPTHKIMFEITQWSIQ